jgi:hypothetical protein
MENKWLKLAAKINGKLFFSIANWKKTEENLNKILLVITIHTVCCTDVYVF